MGRGTLLEGGGLKIGPKARSKCGEVEGKETEGHVKEEFQGPRRRNNAHAQGGFNEAGTPLVACCAARCRVHKINSRIG